MFWLVGFWFCCFLKSLNKRFGDGFDMCFCESDFLFMGWKFELLIWGFINICVIFWLLVLEFGYDVFI